MTSVLVRIVRVSALIVRMSFPATSGAFSSDHRLKCARPSVPVSEPTPTSSMSGSFQPPGPEYASSPTCWSRMPVIEFQLAWMSPVVRQELPTGIPQVHTLSCPQLHKLYTIGRPVAARASRMAVYRCCPFLPWWSPQLSYLR